LPICTFSCSFLYAIWVYRSIFLSVPDYLVLVGIRGDANDLMSIGDLHHVSGHLAYCILFCNGRIALSLYVIHFSECFALCVLVALLFLLFGMCSCADFAIWQGFHVFSA